MKEVFVLIPYFWAVFGTIFDLYLLSFQIYEIRDRLTEVIRAWPQAWGPYEEHSIAVITPYPDQAMGLRIKLKLEGFAFVDVEALSNVLCEW